MNEVRRTAAMAGLPMPALSFARKRGREWLQIGAGDATKFYDGSNDWEAGGAGLRGRIDEALNPLVDLEPADIATARAIPQLPNESADPETDGSVSAFQEGSSACPDHPEHENQKNWISEGSDPEEEPTDPGPDW